MSNYTVLCTEKFSVTTLDSTRMKRSFRLSVKDALLTEQMECANKQIRVTPLERFLYWVVSKVPSEYSESSYPLSLSNFWWV